ncbi:hypothetical protein B296_00052142, partial [Ensete ventricosum]
AGRGTPRGGEGAGRGDRGGTPRGGEGAGRGDRGRRPPLIAKPSSANRYQYISRQFPISRLNSGDHPRFAFAFVAFPPSSSSAADPADLYDHGSSSVSASDLALATVLQILHAKGGFRVLAVFGDGEGSGSDKKNTWGEIFDVEVPRPRVQPLKGKFLDVNQALEVARMDIQYCDWRARQDVLSIMLLHEKVLNPLARDFKSIGTMKKELAELQEDLEQAHRQVHISEARVAAALDKLAYMESLVSDRLLQEKSSCDSSSECITLTPSTSSASKDPVKSKSSRRSLNVSGPVQPYHPSLKNFWYPVAFSKDLKDDTMIVMELPVEHGLLLDNLLDLAHAPFTHTTTFAKGWNVPSLVKFLTPASGLQGYWDPYPIDMEFRPPCIVLSTIGISKPGKLEGRSTRQCSTHLHQLHVLNEDLRLVIGQQDRMINGANVWNSPVSYDKLGIRYRLWRDALERGVDHLPLTNQDN